MQFEVKPSSQFGQFCFLEARYFGFRNLNVLIFLKFPQRNCAANFSFAQLAKRKSLGRSKPATNS